MRITVYCTREMFVDVLSLSASWNVDRTEVVQRLINKAVLSVGLCRLPSFVRSERGLSAARRVLVAKNSRRLQVRVDAKPIEALMDCTSFKRSKSVVFLVDMGLDLEFGESRPSSVAARPALSSVVEEAA